MDTTDPSLTMTIPLLICHEFNDVQWLDIHKDVDIMYEHCLNMKYFVLMAFIYISIHTPGLIYCSTFFPGHPMYGTPENTPVTVESSFKIRSARYKHLGSFATVPGST